MWLLSVLCPAAKYTCRETMQEFTLSLASEEYCPRAASEDPIPEHYSWNSSSMLFGMVLH
jgi:hypothetical protein